MNGPSRTCRPNRRRKPSSWWQLLSNAKSDAAIGDLNECLGVIARVRSRHERVVFIERTLRSLCAMGRAMVACEMGGDLSASVLRHSFGSLTISFVAFA